jgi:hypothetical protein
MTDDPYEDPPADFPPRPDFLPLSYSEREEVFGHIDCVPKPSPGNPEGVLITNNFAKRLVRIQVPQLERIPGMLFQGKMIGHGPKNGMVLLHELAAQPMLDLWNAWEDAGLLDRVITDAGMQCARYVRGSTSVLSNHSYGTAFDINAPWNALKRTPAPLGARGCVRELVPLANHYGWWWGGHGWPPDYTKLDGMHFELAKLKTIPA